MKKILPHIYVENCKEELEYYKQIFGGEIKNAQTGDGMEMFKGHEGKYIHAELHINENCVIYFADAFRPLIKGDNVWTTLDMSSEDEINSIYEKLSKDGEIHMELQDTFWNSRFAVVKDKNGFTWELNYAKQV
ncbi:VOC family protein [Gottfriedia acidiceleris]|uniref:VOC family protein n=1 Tax=Gottfriedia acidiceleris TaxID=371036 RepID=UPI000B43EAC8|nr:VOC family protein [Gottfriedia acidiceleris]